MFRTPLVKRSSRYLRSRKKDMGRLLPKGNQMTFRQTFFCSGSHILSTPLGVKYVITAAAHGLRVATGHSSYSSAGTKFVPSSMICLVKVSCAPVFGDQTIKPFSKLTRRALTPFTRTSDSSEVGNPNLPPSQPSSAHLCLIPP